MSGKVIDKDHGWQAFQRTVKELAQSPNIVCGLTGSLARAAHRGSKTGETVAGIAARHEFGIGVPERSFLRSTLDKNRAKYMQMVTRGLQQELTRAIQTRKPFNIDNSNTFAVIGLKMEGDIKQRISAREIPPPNAPSTIKRKGSSTPLVDTGQLRAAIAVQIRKGKGREK